MNVGVRVAEERRRLGWSQARLAERAGLHKNTVFLCEKTGSVRLDTLGAIAKALGMSWDDLLVPPAAAPVRRKAKRVRRRHQ